jgi:trigger factor
MQIQIQDVSPVEKKLVVEVPWQTVSDRLGDAYRQLARHVNIKGFRKGKVPRSVLERMYGKQVRAEVAERLVQESFITATKEHKLAAVSEPRVDEAFEVRPGQPFAFEAIVEVRGEVVASGYRGLALKKRRLEVGDEAVEQALQNLRREHTDLNPIEERDTLAETDVVRVRLHGDVGEQHVHDRDFTVELDDASGGPLPGLASRLVGLPRTAQEHLVEYTIPAAPGEGQDENAPDAPEAAGSELAGQKVSLRVTVLDARVKSMPALDDEFAKDTERAGTLEELRAVLRVDLEAQQREEIARELRQAALKEIVKANQVPVASSLVERAIEYRYENLKAMLGMPAGQQAPIPEGLRDSLREGAADEVRGQLLMDAIAKQENIEVGDEELSARVAEMAQRRNAQPARLRAEMERDGRLDNLRFMMLQEKTLDFVVARAEVTEVDAAVLKAEAEAEEKARAGRAEAQAAAGEAAGEV